MYLFFSSDNKNNKFSTSIKPFLIFSFISLVCARSMSVQEETPASPGTNQDDHLGVLIPCTIIGGILFMAMLILAELLLQNQVSARRTQCNYTKSLGKI